MKFYVGDKVRIDNSIVGVTAIVRGNTYTIKEIHTEAPNRIFPLVKEKGEFLTFHETGGYFSEKYFILIKSNPLNLPEELFTL